MTEQGGLNIPPQMEQPTGDTVPESEPIPQTEGNTGVAEHTEEDEIEVSEAIQEATEGIEAPTSNDVGKQTLTQADLGYDVTVEGVPPDEVALATPQHPDDPSAYEETQRDPTVSGGQSQAETQ